MMSLPKRRRALLWSRDDISCCSCPDLNSVHAHCPCDSCCGKAVARATEYRHWVATRDYVHLMEQDTEPAEQQVEHNIEQQEPVQAMEQWAGHNVRRGGEHEAGQEFEIENEVLVGQSMEQRADLEQEQEAVCLDEELQEGEELDQDGMTHIKITNDGYVYPHALYAGDTLQLHRVKMDVMNAVLKAFQLAEEMDASQQNFLKILQYGKEQYCKGTAGARFEYLWPQSWQSAIKMLADQGYQDAVDYFVCLSNNHFCSYDIFSGLKSTCRLCGSPASSCIKYSYLPLKHKVRQWCNSSSFCHKTLERKGTLVEQCTGACYQKRTVGWRSFW